jgi:hypothetical protein
VKKKKAAKTGKAKTSRKRAGVKDLSAKKAAVVRGGLPAAARMSPGVPTEQLSVNYGKIQF